MSNSRSGALYENSSVPQALLSPWVLLSGVLALTALVFLPTLRFEFTYDDQGQIVQNALIREWKYVPEYFQSHVWAYLYPNAAANYYRPLNVLWFRINDALFGLQPMGWHASTVALHLLCTALVFAIARRVMRRPLPAAVAALLFGIHPTRHEVVSWVSGSTESLCAALFLSSLLAYLVSRERRTTAWMTVSCFLYGLGLLAKETVVVLPAIIMVHALLYGVYESEAPPAGLWRRLVAAAARASVYIPLVMVYLGVRIHVLRGFSHAQTNMSRSEILLTLPSVVWFYLKQWFLPVRISEIYELAPVTGWDPVRVAVPLAALLVTAATLWYFRRKLGGRDLLFALAAIAFPLAPVLYISVFPEGELVHDRYLYLPGLGFALLVALALQHLCQGRMVFRLPRRLVFAMLALILPLAYGTANASSYWVDDYTLFEHAHSLAPDNSLARNNYAIELAHHGRPGEGLKMLQELVKEHPKYFLPTYNLGRTYYELNLLAPAYYYLQVARNLQPDAADVYLQLGLVCLKNGKHDEAFFNFQYAVALRPRDPQAHFALGVILADRKDCQSARGQFSEALSLDPGFVKAKQQMELCAVVATEGTAATSRSERSAQPLAKSAPVARVPLEPVKIKGR